MKGLSTPEFIRNPFTLHGLYVGEVVDNVDPDNTQRVRIFIHGVHVDRNVEGLPWAVPILPLLGTGTVGVPDNNELVWVFFINGCPEQPAYLGRAADSTYDVSEQTFGFVVKDGSNKVEIVIDRAQKEIRIGSVGGYMIKLGSTSFDTLVKASMATIFNNHLHVVPRGPGMSQPPSHKITDANITQEVEGG